MNPNIRHNIFKTPMSDQEDDRFRKLCARLGKQGAPLIRDLIERACESPCNSSHPSASRVNQEWPRHGHIASARTRRARCPSRSSFGGGPVPKLRV